MNGLLTLEQAQARLLALAEPLPLERVDAPSALGRWLAEPLTARRTQPAAHVSAMDGYAVRADELAGPWQVVGESAAGHPWTGPVRPGEAIRISTGAMVPADAGAVIVQEDTARDGSTLTLTGAGPASPARHIRPAGMEFTCDAQLLATGTRIGPAQIALALTAGHRHLAVRRPARIAIIDSGDELAADPEACLPHQVPASNGAMLAALVASLPTNVTRIGPVVDRIEALVAALDSAAQADVIVTTGGASVGEHDLIRPALERWGANLDFWRVAIKPGKPLLVATKGRQIIVGLPGNPVSSMVTGYLFLLPLLRQMMGAARAVPIALPMELAAALPATGNRREFVRACITPDGLASAGQQDSGALTAIAAADVLVDRPADSPPAPAGSRVFAYLLENGGLV
jgi:molybdopterin molybdotransferase